MGTFGFFSTKSWQRFWNGKTFSATNCTVSLASLSTPIFIVMSKLNIFIGHHDLGVKWIVLHLVLALELPSVFFGAIVRVFSFPSKISASSISSQSIKVNFPSLTTDTFVTHSHSIPSLVLSFWSVNLAHFGRPPYSTHHWCIWQWLYDQLTILLCSNYHQNQQ